MEKKNNQNKSFYSRREFVKDLTVLSTGAALGVSPLTSLAQTKSNKTFILRKIYDYKILVQNKMLI